MIRLPARLRSIRSASNRRTFISAATFTSSDACALLDKLHSHLSKPSADLGLPSATLLSFSQDLYPHLSASKLSSSLLNSSKLSGALLSSPFTADPSRHTFSIARFYNTPSTSYLPFRSSSKGNAPASVGRWRPLGEVPWEGGSDGKEMGKAFEGGDWSKVWEQGNSSEGNDGKRSNGSVSSLEGLEDIKPDSVQSILAFSTRPSTSSFLRELSQVYLSATKAGSIAPQTPFITGLPHTLYHNGKEHHDGSVGIAIIKPSSNVPALPDLQVDWEGLEPLSEDVFAVSQSQGNLLLGLSLPSPPPSSLTELKTRGASSSSSSTNPTQHLLRLLRLSSSPDLHNAQIGKAWLGGKEKDFYVGFLRAGQVDGGKQQVERVVRVLSGDPSRGGMALDTEESVKSGERFIFLHQPTSPSKPSLNDLLSSVTSPDSSVTFSFRTSSASPSDFFSTSTSAVDIQEDVFFASSESGFLFGQPSELGWADSGVPGGSVRLVVPASE